jgi:hypothetical protein
MLTVTTAQLTDRLNPPSKAAMRRMSAIDETLFAPRTGLDEVRRILHD